MISDSLALPRLTPEKVGYTETYYAKLIDSFKEIAFLQLFIGGATLPFLVQKSGYYASFNPDLVVVQSGVVDCAFRAFGEVELKILGKLRIRVPKRLLPFLRRVRKKRYTSPDHFRRNIQLLQKRFGKERVYWIAIMPASKEWENKVPGIMKSVEKYNGILQEEVGQNIIGSDAMLQLCI